MDRVKSNVKKMRVSGWRCAAMFCGNRSVDSVGVFSWPNPDRSPARHKAWTCIVSTTRADFVYKKTSSFLCSDQFDRSNVLQREMGLTAKWMLATGAVPSTRLLPRKPQQVPPAPIGSVKTPAPRSAFQTRERKRVSCCFNIFK